MKTSDKGYRRPPYSVEAKGRVYKVRMEWNHSCRDRHYPGKPEMV